MLSKNQIKYLQNLQLKKFRDAERLFLVEGVKSVNEVLMQNPLSIKMVYATKEYLIQHSALYAEKKLKPQEVSETELAKISALSTPNKVLAVCLYFENLDFSFDFANRFALYLDDIRDPGNFGTLVRLSDWFGISTIFCSEQSCDLYNPKVIQASMGAFLRVKVHYIALEELILSQHIERVYGAVLDGENVYRQSLQGGLILIGNEANGISETNLKRINKPITIPSASDSKTESLNAAVAASIITSEFYRQLHLK